MSVRLFSEFSPAVKDAWEKQAEKELKGQLKALSDWTIGNLHLEPYITHEELDAEKAAHMQACQKKTPGWQNVPDVTFTDPRKTNAKIKHELENGAHAVILNLGKTDIMHCEFPKLLHGIKLSDTAIYFRTVESAQDLFREISRNAGYYLKGGIMLDPVANWMRTGEPIETHMRPIASVLNQTKNMREFRPYMIEGHLYHNNGADQLQELAFMLAATVECIDRLTNEGISPLIAFNRIFFSVSVGTEYLTEIAKLRALRYLLRKVSDAYQLPHELCPPFIHAQTSTFYNASVSPHTNMIRSASEAMSAVNGGCNALTVVPYDHNLRAPSDFSDRIARNVSLLLHCESVLGYVADPAAGSYMLEKMSLDLAEKAWELFLAIEEKGGFVKSVESGFISNQLATAIDRKVTSLKNGKVMVGVNRFEEMSAEPVPMPIIIHDDMSLEPQLSDKNLAQCYKSSISTSVRS
jgi:methylmalonyl-CoA mutase